MLFDFFSISQFDELAQAVHGLLGVKSGGERCLYTRQPCDGFDKAFDDVVGAHLLSILGQAVELVYDGFEQVTAGSGAHPFQAQDVLGFPFSQNSAAPPFPGSFPGLDPLLGHRRVQLDVAEGEAEDFCAVAGGSFAEG